MKDGTPIYIGDIHKAVQKYGEHGLSASGRFHSNSSRREGEQRIRVEKIALSDGKKNKSTFNRADELCVNIQCQVVEKISSKQKFRVDVNLLNDKGEWIICASGLFHLNDGAFSVNLGKLNLYRGIYTANISILRDDTLQDFLQDAFAFEVLEDDVMLRGVSGVSLREI